MENLNKFFEGYAIEMYFDSQSTHMIKDIWKNINSVLSQNDVRPHISLGGFLEIDTVRIEQAVSKFCQSIKPFSLHLGSVGSFPTNEGVLFIAPVMTKELLENHSKFYNILNEYGIVARGLYLPDQWIPHCTVDIYLKEKELPSKFSLLQHEKIHKLIKIEEVGIVKYFPPEKIFNCKIKD